MGKGSEEIDQRIKDVIKKILFVKNEDIKNETTIAELGGDSLSSLRILSALEKEFDIDISDEDAQTIKTFGAAVKVVKKCLNSDSI